MISEHAERIAYLASEMRYQAEMALCGADGVSFSEAKDAVDAKGAIACGPTLRPHERALLTAALLAANKYHAECARLALTDELRAGAT